MWTARKKFGITSNLILRLEIQACKRGGQIILQLNGWPGVNVRERYSISMVPSFKFFPLNGQMWLNGQITSWNIYLSWKRFWHVAFSNSLIIREEYNECLEISWKTAHFLHPKFFLLKLFPLRSNIKHSAQCFFTRWNISKLVKNTPLRVVFSTLFSVFHLVMKTASLAWYITSN